MLGCRYHSRIRIVCASLLFIRLVAMQTPAHAVNPAPQSGSIGLEGTISTAPPSRAATIALPANGAVFTATPITDSGLCASGLLIKVFDNGVFVGSIICSNGSYSLQISLFNGQNNLVTQDYDALNQEGPVSNTVTVTLNDTQFLQFGTPLSMSSDYAENGAPPGTEIDWPLQLNGGTAPFAISVDWGDGSPQELLSAASDGTITIKHTYRTAGVYTVVVKAVDKNGETAFLQLVGQATGAIQNNNKPAAGGNIVVEKGNSTIWSSIATVPLIGVSFWIGRKYENQELHKQYLNLNK